MLQRQLSSGPPTGTSTILPAIVISPAVAVWMTRSHPRRLSMVAFILRTPFRQCHLPIRDIPLGPRQDNFAYCKSVSNVSRSSDTGYYVDVERLNPATGGCCGSPPSDVGQGSVPPATQRLVDGSEESYGSAIRGHSNRHFPPKQSGARRFRSLPHPLHHRHHHCPLRPPCAFSAPSTPSGRGTGDYEE
ncbi:hypothetical protein C8F01DRAFT_173591 [Mycena amicta]|nr:hypothetical protein C8F01DRAFT_173591 [Mycena amicta]